MKKINYSPDISTVNDVEAREIVKQVVLEQPGELAPIKVEVTDQFFKMYATKSNQVDGYTIPWNTVVYFNNIGEVTLKIEKKWSKKWYVVAIMDRDNREKYAVYTAHEITAKSFINAIIKLKTGEFSESTAKSMW
jgi:hypothetical protein